MVHELGHFVVARMCGMTVRRFSIGFGPPVVQIERNDTIYQLAAFPVGGFVQVEGLGAEHEARFDHEVLGDANPGSYLSRPLWQRAAMVSAGPLANFGLAAVIYATLFSSGSAVMFEMGRMGTPAIKSVSGAAADAGLRANDVIVYINGKPVAARRDVNTHTRPGEPTTITVARPPDGALHWAERRKGYDRGVSPIIRWPESSADWEQVTVTVIPRRDKNKRLRLGITFVPARFGSEGFADTAGYAMSESWIASSLIVGHLWKALVGKEKLQLASVVKVTEKGADSVEMGYEFFLTLLALISVNLGVINLLPFPALDGGRLIFVGIEAIARKPVPYKVEQVMHAIGFLLLMSLVAVVVAKEIAEKF